MSEISLEILFFLLVCGFLAAFVDSVVGGGGLILIPALLFAGLPPATALGTNKLCSTCTMLTSSAVFFRSGKISRSLVLKLFPLSVVGAVSGAYVVKLIPPAFLKPLIVGLLIVVTLFTLIKKDWGIRSSFTGLNGKTTLFIFSATLVIGFYDGFFGGGTGSFLLFSFLLLGFDFVESAGNAKILNLGSNIAALVTFIWLGAVNFTYGLPLVVAMVLGALVGSKVALKSGARYVKALFVTMTTILVGKSIWDLIH